MSIKKEIELEEEIRLLKKELEVLGDDLERFRLQTEESIDDLKLEIEAIKLLLQQSMEGFRDRFAEAKERVVREIDPEVLKKGV